MNDASFEFNKQLELDVLVSGLTEITDDYVSKFKRYSLDEVIIPEGVQSIGDKAFKNCYSLKKVTIPASVTSIKKYPFRGCDQLKNVTIPDSVTSIGTDAFYCCFFLTRVTFKGKTRDEVRSMEEYPWGISPEKISVQLT